MGRRPLDITVKYVKPSEPSCVNILEIFAGCFAPELFAAVNEIPFALAEARKLSEVDADPTELAKQREIEALERRLAALKGAA